MHELSAMGREAQESKQVLVQGVISLDFKVKLPSKGIIWPCDSSSQTMDLKTGITETRVSLMHP
jgi:hypothetical protein